MCWAPRVSVIIPNCFMYSISYNLIASSPGMSKDSQCVSERIKVKEIKYWSKFIWLLSSWARILNQVLLQPNWKLFINKAPRQGVLDRWDTCWTLMSYHYQSHTQYQSHTFDSLQFCLYQSLLSQVLLSSRFWRYLLIPQHLRSRTSFTLYFYFINIY